MKKVLVEGLLIIILLIAVAFYFFSIKKSKDKTEVAYGYSIKNAETEAVKEAVNMIKGQLENPDYIIMFSTSGYNSELILSEVHKHLSNAKVYGGTSMMGVI